MEMNSIFSEYYNLGYNTRSNLFQGQAQGQGWRPSATVVPKALGREGLWGVRPFLDPYGV